MLNLVLWLSQHSSILIIIEIWLREIISLHLLAFQGILFQVFRAKSFPFAILLRVSLKFIQDLCIVYVVLRILIDYELFHPRALGAELDSAVLRSTHPNIKFVSQRLFLSFYLWRIVIWLYICGIV